MKAFAIQTNFNGGELSTRMQGRFDTKIYPIATAEMLNFAGTVEGPSAKRPGHEMIRRAADSAAWLREFIFNVTQAYVIEIAELLFRFYTNGARIESDPVTPYEVVTPYTAAEAPRLSFQQSFDRLYIAHANHPPAALTRLTADTFDYDELALVNGPFKDRNTDETIKVSADDVTGSITLTATTGIWQAGHVGGLFRLEAQDFSDVLAWEAGFSGIDLGDYRRSDGKIYQCIDSANGRTGSVQPIHTAGAEWDGTGVGQGRDDKDAGGKLWQYICDRFGIIRITAYTSATEVTGTVLRRLPSSLVTVPSFRWYHGAFSDAEGWPQIVTIWNSRLVFAKGFQIFGSVVGDYLNFADFTNSGLLAADLSFRYTLSSADPILALVPDLQLLALTARAEYPIGALNTAAAAGPGNLGVTTRPTFYGSAEVWPARLGAQMHFVQRGGRKVREAEFNFARNGYTAENTTVWSRQVTESGIIQLAWQQAPEEIEWGVRGDGILAAHPFSPEQEVKGWSRAPLGGGARVLSAIAIPSEDGTADEIWLLVQRGAVREVWQQKPWWSEGGDRASAWFVDGGISYDGAPSTHFTGAGHLAGELVWCLADGAVIPPFVMPVGGAFDLVRAASKVIVGLPYIARITLLRPQAQLPGGGTSQGRLQKLVSAIVRLIDSLGLWLGGNNGLADEMILRTPSVPMGSPPPLFNGDTERLPVPADFDQLGQLVIESRQPLPCMVSVINSQIEVGDG